VVSKDKNNVQALLVLALSYAQKGSIDYSEGEYGMKALDTVNKAIMLDAANTEAYRIKGFAYEIMQKYDEALLAYNTAIDIDSENAMAFSSRGHAYDLQGMTDKAIADYEQALKLDADLDHANLNLARVYIRTGESLKALPLLEKVSSASQNTRFKASAEQLMGVIYFAQEKNADAKARFENAIFLDPKLSTAYVGHGHAVLNEFFDNLKVDPNLEAEGVLEIVFTDIQKAIEINVNQTTAYLLAAQVLDMTRDFDESALMLAQAEKSVEVDITLGQAEKDLLRAEIKKLKQD
jgi:tetratricopeptide (TPR) repeat protein